MSLTLAAAQIEASPGRLDQAIAVHVRMAGAAADGGAGLVVFPELSLTGYSRALKRHHALNPNASEFRPLAETASKRRITIVAGAPMESPEGLWITSFCFLPDGRITTHTKQHLHPGEEICFVAGPGGPPLIAAKTKVGLAICADIDHPSHAADSVQQGARIYAASCFFTPGGYDACAQRMQACAKEHRVIALLANFTGSSGGFESAGQSAIWDKTGKVLAVAPRSGECLAMAECEAGS